MADRIGELVAALAKQLGQAPEEARKPAPPPDEPAKALHSGRRYTAADYPMHEKHGPEIRTPTGRRLEEITLDGVLSGAVTIKDVRISREMLEAQAQIAEDAGKPAMGENLRRAAELTGVPDDEVIRMYDMLRPNRSTGPQLDGLARALEERYGAPRCAALVREAAAVYARRGILLAGEGK